MSQSLKKRYKVEYHQHRNEIEWKNQQANDLEEWYREKTIEDQGQNPEVHPEEEAAWKKTHYLQQQIESDCLDTMKAGRKQN